MISLITQTAQETIKVGQRIGGTLLGGETIILFGELGSGKTTLVKGLARGLKIRPAITSPTFTLVKPYRFGAQKNKTFYHIDLYRLGSKKELEELGVREIIGKNTNIVVIEWPKKILNLLPKETISIKLNSVGASPDLRKIQIW